VRWQEPQSCLIPSRAWKRFHDRLQPFIFAILDDNASLRGRSVFGHFILGGTAEAATILDDFAQHGIEISAFVICEPNKERALELSNRTA
jgi:hypothetical protein